MASSLRCRPERKRKETGFPGRCASAPLDGKNMKVKWLDKYCNICGEQLNSWDARLSKTLAYKIPVCEKCIAKEYDMEVESLRDRMENYFGMRPCQGI